MGLRREIKLRQLRNVYVYKLSHSSTELKSTVKMSGSSTFKNVQYSERIAIALKFSEGYRRFITFFVRNRSNQFLELQYGRTVDIQYVSKQSYPFFKTKP